MGLFSIFGKKDLEAEQKLLKKIEELEQTIARKDKEISDLINELDRVNQSIPNTNTNTNLNSKQLELIEKNIKDTKEENDRLKQVIDEYNLSSKKENIHFTKAAENIASGHKTPEFVVERWLKSKGHHKNILGKDYRFIGIGKASDNEGKLYWVQIFTN